MISILDYGAGNLRSVENTLGAIRAEYELTRDAAALDRATKIILPGVGHFGQMMRALDELHVRDALLGRIRAGVPFLGICLGLQALFEASEEAPEARGLALFPGEIKRFRGDARVPHMGWNSLERTRESSQLLAGTGETPFVYFANSFYAPAGPEASATCLYGTRFTAVIEHNNINAVQFHPEKSGAAGLKILSNFVCS
ncbi:MAG TPA: imidazole glycerol phosphate synthase subunit HisH [Bryobacteraceae bacterium]|nr:imidazole glycerol phosphate synthase subunit HisH [Bryobacteraceae bacterium]